LLESNSDSLGVLRCAPRVEQARMLIGDRVLTAPIEPPAASLSRYELDAMLWDAAARVGVQQMTLSAVESISEDAGLVVRTSGGNFEARAVINAAGRWSNLSAQRHIRAKQKWIGLKAHFAETTSSRTCDLYFFSGGYCGVQPLAEGRLNACALVRATVAKELRAVFQQHPKLLERSSQWQQITETVSTSPVLFPDPQPVRDGVLNVGDAAGFIDPFAGDGISLALQSGKLAADCLYDYLGGRVTLEAASANYSRTYRRRFAAAFRNAARMRKLLQAPAPLRRLMLLPLSSHFVMRKLVRSTRAKV
jgi:menaquinone-9 beta-reductase